MPLRPALIAALFLLLAVFLSILGKDEAPAFPICPTCVAGNVRHYRIGCKTCGTKPPDVDCCRGPHAVTTRCEACALKASECLACGQALRGETVFSPEQALGLQVHLKGRRIACRGVLTGEARSNPAPGEWVRHYVLGSAELVSAEKLLQQENRLQIRTAKDSLESLTPYSRSEVVVRGILTREGSAPCFLKVEDIRFSGRKSDPALRPIPVAALKADRTRKGVLTAVVGYVRDHGSAWHTAFLGDGPEKVDEMGKVRIGDGTNVTPGPNLLLHSVDEDADVRHPKDNRWVRVDGFWDGDDGFVAVSVTDVTEKEARTILKPEGDRP